LLVERLEINPRDAEDWIHLAAAVADLGQAERARESIERALALPPGDAAVLALAGPKLHSLGARGRSRRHLVEAVVRGFAPQPLLRNPALAWLERDEVFQRALAERSRNPGESGSPTHTEGGRP